MLRKARKYHKWLMAFVGIQFLFWSITGVYMVTMDIHYIHGETLAKSEEAKIDLASMDYSIVKLAADYPKASQVTLTQSMGRPLYSFINGENGKYEVIIPKNRVGMASMTNWWVLMFTWSTFSR